MTGALESATIGELVGHLGADEHSREVVVDFFGTQASVEGPGSGGEDRGRHRGGVVALRRSVPSRRPRVEAIGGFGEAAEDR